MNMDPGLYLPFGAAQKLAKRASTPAVPSGVCQSTPGWSADQSLLGPAVAIVFTRRTVEGHKYSCLFLARIPYPQAISVGSPTTFSCRGCGIAKKYF